MDQGDAQETYKKLKVSELRDYLIRQYYMMTPEVCCSCHCIYEPLRTDVGNLFYICDKMLCLECCPKNNDTEGYQSILFFLLSAELGLSLV